MPTEQLVYSFASTDVARMRSIRAGSRKGRGGSPLTVLSRLAQRGSRRASRLSYLSPLRRKDRLDLVPFGVLQ